jgi:murein DD-endopeptidase MepM/ murein hydrolase activator NlpD
MRRLKNAPMQTSNILKKICLMIASLTLVAGFLYMIPALRSIVHAETAEQINAKIKDVLLQREAIQKEIDALSGALDTTTRQAQTYTNALRTLELTQKKLEANLRLTSSNLSETVLTLEQIKEDIAIAEKGIASTSAAVSRNIKDMSQAESESTIESLLKNKSMSDAFDYVNALKTVQTRIKINLENLRDTRMVLGAKRDQAQGQKDKLQSYQKALSDQKKVVEYNQDEKTKLQAQAKQTLAMYAAQLETKKKERDAFEKELFDYESKLKITLDPNAIPTARTGLLSWPFASTFIDTCAGKQRALGNIFCITQTFGSTAFSRATGYYSGNGHNGIDFGANTGTRVQAALSGTVTDVENTTAKKGCQYGYWVLIRHANGLSTLYAHLSVVSVRPGDILVTGDTIGYSGNTGLSTGPHLHFGVYATQGVRVVRAEELKPTTTCRGIKTVAAASKAYLNPIAYLPF